MNGHELPSEKTYSVWWETDDFFAERKVQAGNALMAIIRASVALAAEGGFNATIANEANEIHCKEVE